MKPDSCKLVAYLILFLAVSATFNFNSVLAQKEKPVLVIFHGAQESKEDLRELAQASHESKLYQKVVVIGFDWKGNRLSEAAPRIFGSLSNRFPNSEFVLMGNKEGGILAEWIATKVKPAEGKVIRVITMNTPFDEKVGVAVDVISELKRPPLNDAQSVEFIRLWQKDNKDTSQASALQVLTGGQANTSRFIVRTKPFDPRELIPEMIVKAKKDYEAERYNQVVEACRYILKYDPQQQEISTLFALSLYNLGNYSRVKSFVHNANFRVLLFSTD